MSNTGIEKSNRASGAADLRAVRSDLAEQIYPISTTEKDGYPRCERLERDRAPRRKGAVACLEYLVEHGLIDEELLREHLHRAKGESDE